MHKLFIFFLLLAGGVQSETIYTFWNSDPAAEISQMGWGSTFRIAQVFTAPSTDTVLKSFAFQAYGKDTAQFTVTLWGWNSATDSLLSRVNASNYEWWGVLNHGNNSVTQQNFTFSGFEYQLNAGERYALVFQGYGSGMLNWRQWSDPSMRAIGNQYVTTDPALYPFADYGNTQSLTQLTFIPEPSSLSLLVLGGAVVALCRRKRA
jgi:hypothetical protein